MKLPLFGHRDKTEEEEPFRWLSAAEAKAMLDAGSAPIIDVREPYEYKSGHIPGALNVPLNTFLRQPRQYVTTDTVLLVCAAGHRSTVASEMAASLGVKQVFNLRGGTNGWIAKGYPVEK